MTTRGTQYRKTTQPLTCGPCIDNRARRRAADARAAETAPEAPAETAPAPAAENAPGTEYAAAHAQLAAEVGVRSAVIARHGNAHSFNEVADEAGVRIGWTFRHGFGAAARYGWATTGGRVSAPNGGATYRWEADRDLRQVHADGAGTGPDNLLACLPDEHRPTYAQLVQMLDNLQVDEVRLCPDGAGKWAVQRGPHFMGTVHDEGARMRRGRYAAWAPYTNRRDGVVGFFHDLDAARDAVAQAWPVTVAEIAGETGIPAGDVLDAAEALAAEWGDRRRAVLRIAAATGPDTKVTPDAAAAILRALPATLSTVARVAAVEIGAGASRAAGELAAEWEAKGPRAVFRSVVTTDADISPAAAAVLIERLTPQGLGSVPFHGPNGHTGPRALCSYDDHGAPLAEDGRVAEHELWAGQIHPCPGSLKAGRAHLGQATRKHTTALSYNGPRDTWLVSGARAGDVVVVDGQTATVENFDLETVNDTPTGRVCLVLSGYGAPLVFDADEALPFKRRVRRQDARCQGCEVYTVVDDDTAANGSVQGRLCGVCDGPVPVERARRAESLT